MIDSRQKEEEGWIPITQYIEKEFIFKMNQNQEQKESEVQCAVASKPEQHTDYNGLFPNVTRILPSKEDRAPKATDYPKGSKGTIPWTFYYGIDHYRIVPPLRQAMKENCMNYRLTEMRKDLEDMGIECPSTGLPEHIDLDLIAKKKGYTYDFEQYYSGTLEGKDMLFDVRKTLLDIENAHSARRLTAKFAFNKTNQGPLFPTTKHGAPSDSSHSKASNLLAEASNALPEASTAFPDISFPEVSSLSTMSEWNQMPLMEKEMDLQNMNLQDWLVKNNKHK